ncbi:H-NS family nucleoid-associated regulatory protein [Ruegeria sp. EL01]|uniref:H-NS histone family protein n=1 Tax=Ruegeria sp. EL01 TaxID=2107578 RepID=UPI000EA8311E|nr:H-NS histone family protein [Ruegeria sp. EL01]
MKSKDLDKMSVAQLRDLQTDISKALKAAETRDRKAALDAARAVALEKGFTLEELMGGAAKPRKAPAAAKYRHPENPSLTWSGRGRQPAWFKEAVLGGANPDDLVI